MVEGLDAPAPAGSRAKLELWLMYTVNYHYASYSGGKMVVAPSPRADVLASRLLCSDGGDAARVRPRSCAWK